MPEHKVEHITAKLLHLKPYSRNARRGTNVEMVKESIKRYGYNQPILIDEKMNIVAGHSRYKALLELGYEEAQVLVVSGLTNKQLREYRILDNKIQENNGFIFGQLKIELRDLNIDELQPFFPDIALQQFVEETMGATQNQVTSSDVQNAAAKLEEKISPNDSESEQ